MKKSLQLLVALIMLATLVTAQNAEDVKSNPGEYLYGEGVGSTLQQADRQALAELISQISVTVESSFTHQVVEEGQGAGSFSEKVKSVVNTYSNATLTNAERLIVNDEPNARVMRYIRRADLQKIFDQRRRRINDFIAEAGQYASRAQVADALKYYYWALVLLRSHPDANSLVLEGDASRPLLNVWIPARINDLFAGLSFSLGPWQQENGYTAASLRVNYQGAPARNFDYTWFDGRDWGAVVSAKDGDGFVEMPGTSKPATVKIKAEYMFTGEARADKELEQVMEATVPVPFRNAYFVVNQGEVARVSASAASEVSRTEAPVTAVSFAGVTEVKSVAPFETIVKRVGKALEAGQAESVRDCFTAEGYEMLERLTSYGRARTLQSDGLKGIATRGKTIVRPLRMAFSFESNKKFVEDLVFTFNEKQKIESIAFGLNQTAVNDILANDTWPIEERLTIITFLEHYKTAYALKRLDYIESVFSDKAVIIVGSYLKINPTPENRFQNRILKYNQMTKTQYLKNLEASFRSKEFINIEFEDNVIRKAMTKSGKGNLYGIQIKQNYYSSNYGDVGYLYLQVEFPDADTPVIYVRTWQPEKNADGSIYGMTDF